MSIFHTPALLGSSGQENAYQIPRSVRFNSSDSAYLSKTFASAGNQKTWTWSAWVKRSRLGVDQAIWTTVPNNNIYGYLYFPANDTIRFQIRDQINSPTYNSINITSAVYRDTSAWYHIVVHLDTTQATATNRAKLYVNGVEQVFGQDQRSSIPQNRDAAFNAAQPHAISGDQPFTGGLHFNGYLADINFIGGQALDPTSFGKFDANGVWQPIAYAGSYGTNGFHLDFADNSSAAALGYDAAGSNDWTVNNLSVTAGAGNDSLRDSPTNGTQTDTGAGGEVVGNYCTLNPLDSTGTLTNGNLDWLNGQNRSTIQVPTSGKWYVEQTFATLGTFAWGADIGLRNYNSSRYAGLRAAAAKAFQNLGTENTPTHSQCAPGDTIGIAINSDNGSITFYKNNTNVWQITNIANISNLFFWCSTDAGGDSGSWNFGSRPFAYTAPSGFKALCTTNLPAPTIEDGSTAMDVVTYTGNGSTQAISGLAFSPDLVWIKSRSLAYNHRLIDSVRGVQKFLSSNTTNAEVTSTLNDRFTSFDATGFTLGAADSPSADGLNQNAATYVGWCWDGGTSTVTNTDGTITSSVRANVSAGISIVGYTGNGTQGATIGHGLSVEPSLLLFKQRNSSSTTARWWTFHSSVVSPNANWWRNYSALELTNAFQDWGDNTGLAAAPSSTVITVGNYSGINSSSNTFICYAFTPVSGFSAFGSYTGNGSADGPFVYTGFRPRWILIKSSSIGGSTYDWFVYDTARDTFNAASRFLSPNYLGAEQVTDDAGTLTDLYFDVLSNGFKLRTNRGRVNLNAATFVYAAFAEHPFSLARAR